MTHSADVRQRGILRTVLRALIGDDPNTAPIGAEQGGCMYCGATPALSPLGVPAENDHTPKCPFRVGHQALRTTTDPDWVTGLREDEAHCVVAIAKQLADSANMVDWGKFNDLLEQRRFDHAGWQGLVRSLEDDRLVELSAKLTGGRRRFSVERFVMALGGRP